MWLCHVVFKNTWYSFCLFCEYLFEIINYYMHYIHMCYTCLAWEPKMASILRSIVGSSVGFPLKCPLFPYLKIVGYPLSWPLSCLLYPYMEVVGSLISIEKFPWAAHSAAKWAAHCLHIWKKWQNSHWQPMGSPLLCPLSCPLFFIFASSWLPTELLTVSIYGSSGQPYLHANSAAHWAANCLHIWKKWAA